MIGYDLEATIAECMREKDGDKSFILTCEAYESGGGNIWIAALGNRSRYVPIGENIAYGVGPEHVDFYVEAENPMLAVMKLRQKIIAAKHPITA